MKTERLLLIIVNLVIIALGLFFIFEASSVESFNVTRKAQQRQIQQLQQQNSDELAEQTDPEIIKPHVWLLTKKQLLGFAIGVLFFVVGAMMPKKYWLKLAPVFFGIAIVLLLLVFIPPFANPQQGAHRWLKIFGHSFQPIEIVKLFLVIFFAWLFSRKTDPLTFLIYLVPPAFLIAIQPDFASLVLVVGAVAVMYFLAGASWKNILILGGLGIVALVIVMFSASYRLDRIQTFMSGGATKSEQLENGRISDEDWHVTQLKYAFGSGGWFGLGVGKSMQKYGWLPETSSDSILGIVGEELGFVGMTLVIALYLTYFYLAVRIINQIDVELGLKLLGYGMITLLALQTLLHLWAVTGLAPLTGITLPFFSYGSSSLTASMFITGVILGISAPEKRLSLAKN